MLVDLDGDGDLDAVVGERYGTLRYFENTGSATAPDLHRATGADNPFDGLDVGDLAASRASPISTATATSTPSLGSGDGTLRYFENIGSATAPAFVVRTGCCQSVQRRRCRASAARPSVADLDGDGDLDAVVGAYDGTLRYFHNTTPHQPAPDFAEQAGAANPFNGVVAGTFSKPSFADLDGDGDLDAIVGEGFGQLHYFQNTGSATAPAFVEQAGAANPFSGVDVGAYSKPSFADLDGDGDLDAVVGEHYGTLRYFKNTGSASAPAFTEQSGAANPFNGVDVGYESAPSFADLDGDGDLDVVAGVRDGTLRYFKNIGSATAPDFAEQTGAANPFNGVDVGLWSVPSFADLDGDGDLDAVVGEFYGSLRYFKNTGSTTAPAFTEQTGAANPFNGIATGNRGTPSFADIDGDGDLDLVLGANDGTLHYYKNTGAGFTLVVNVTAQNDAATLSADVRNLTETNAAADISSLRHADHQRRRQRRDLRGAGRHRRHLRHLRHRRGRRLDLHRQLRPQRVRRRHHLHRHLLGRQRRRHADLGHHQHPRHQRRRGAVRRRAQPDRDQRAAASPAPAR